VDSTVGIENGRCSVTTKTRANVALAIAAIASSALLIWATRHSSAPSLPFPAVAAAANPLTVSITGAASLGHRNAPVVLMEFSDFECQFCGRFAAESLPVLKRTFIETGTLQFVYFHAPHPSMRPLALQAAETAECAGRQGRFWDVHDAFFAHPDTRDSAGLRTLALEAGVRNEGTDALDECLTSRRSLGAIADQSAIAYELNVRSTPSFALGYRRDGNDSGGDTIQIASQFSGALSMSSIGAEIERLLTASRTPSSRATEQ
jgi:protein-disulfide isomerase